CARFLCLLRNTTANLPGRGSPAPTADCQNPSNYCCLPISHSSPMLAMSRRHPIPQTVPRFFAHLPSWGHHDVCPIWDIFPARLLKCAFLGPLTGVFTALLEWLMPRHRPAWA